MKDYVAQPDVLVNVKHAAEHDDRARPAQGLTVIGAAAKLADLVEHTALGKAYPAMADCRRARSARPRSATPATVGGNLMQRPRCWVLQAARTSTA